jgi:adenylate cyclase class 2
MVEIEVKILDIDPETVRQCLTAQGATFEFHHEFWAMMFDDADGKIVAKGNLLRLRKEGETVRLTFKHKVESGPLKVMEETETVVEDLLSMREILLKLGYRITRETRKFRTQYALPQGHVVIDAYQDQLAAIPPFVEIETDSKEKLYEIVSLLGFRPEDCKNWNTNDLMKHYQI